MSNKAMMHRMLPPLHDGLL